MSVDEGDVRGSVEWAATEEVEAAAVSVALDVDAGAEGAEECLCECDILGKGLARKGDMGLECISTHEEGFGGASDELPLLLDGSAEWVPAFEAECEEDAE